MNFTFILPLIKRVVLDKPHILATIHVVLCSHVKPLYQSAFSCCSTFPLATSCKDSTTFGVCLCRCSAVFYLYVFLLLYLISATCMWLSFWWCFFNWGQKQHCHHGSLRCVTSLWPIHRKWIADVWADALLHYIFKTKEQHEVNESNINFKYHHSVLKIMYLVIHNWDEIEYIQSIFH